MNLAPLQVLEKLLSCAFEKIPGGGRGILRGEFSAGKIPYFNLVQNFPLIFRGRCGIFPVQNCACVSRRRTRLDFFLGMSMLNKDAHQANTYGGVQLFDSSRFGRCGIFPLIFWDRCGIFPVQNLSPVEKTLYRIPPVYTSPILPACLHVHTMV